MESQIRMCDDEVLLLESSSPAQSRRVWPYVCGLAIVAVAGGGGHAICQSSNVDAAISMHSFPWVAAWRSHAQRYDENGCTLDGDDCRSSRCCAKPGSSCFVKNKHWASCNETCQTNRKWEGHVDRRGHWVTTSHHVWECLDISVARVPQSVAQTTAAPTPIIVEVPASTSAPAGYSIYEERTDYRTSEYGDRAVSDSKSSEQLLPNTDALVTWEDEKTD